ncbi:MAG TPA: cation:proton antiporter, partial [Thermoanaerobaculia bacterium]|nr:cation:proton antiporter [Thermoanaerobaculia bacterium]
MEHVSVLGHAVPILVAAVAVVLVCLKLRVPPVAGLLVAGAAIGPSGLGWVTDPAEVRRFAEIGVVLLLFVIGLEFSRERIRELGRTVAIGGSLQTLLTFAAGAGAALAFGRPLRVAVLVGFVVCLSSTALVLKLLGDRDELGSLHGRAAFGILIFQDLLVVPLLVAVPALGGARSDSLGELGRRLGLGLLLVAAAALLGRWVLPRVLGLASRRRSREAFLLTAIAACLGMAWWTESLGLSAALGAFLAGVLLADSEFAHSAMAEVVPLREVFASLFFVSMGMLVDLAFLRERPGTVAVAVAATIAVKAVLAGLAVRALGLPRRTALLGGLALAQVGEFSFVLLELAHRQELLDPGLDQLLLSVAALSMLAPPALVGAGPALAARLPARARGAAAEAEAAAYIPDRIDEGYGP